MDDSQGSTWSEYIGSTEDTTELSIEFVDDETVLHTVYSVLLVLTTIAGNIGKTVFSLMNAREDPKRTGKQKVKGQPDIWSQRPVLRCRRAHQEG